MTCRALIFDLDGTLLDTLTDIAAAGNHMLTQMDRVPLPTDAYRRLAGQGLRWLVEHALRTDDDAEIARGIALFREYYDAHEVDHTKPYAGIEAMLDALAERDLVLSILSNKPDPVVRAVVARLLGRWTFAGVLGQKDGVPPKPATDMPRALLADLGVEPGDCVYLGDTDVDMLTAKGVGIMAVGATWGFRDEAELRGAGADVVIDEPMELVKVVDGDGGVGRG